MQCNAMHVCFNCGRKPEKLKQTSSPKNLEAILEASLQLRSDSVGVVLVVQLNN